MLAIWDAFLAALDNPQSAAIYALLVLLQLSAVSLLLQRRTGNGGVPSAVNRGLLGLMVLHLAELPVAGLAWRGNEIAYEAMPAVLRGVHLLSLMLLFWLWLGRESERGLPILGLGLAIGLGMTAGMTSLWLRQPDEMTFNFSNLDYIWGGLCLLLLAVAGLITLLRRKERWLLAVLSFGLLFAGQGVNLLLALPGAELPVAAMLPVLLALPLLYALPVHFSADTQESNVLSSDLEAEAGYVSSFEYEEAGEPFVAGFAGDFEALEDDFDQDSGEADAADEGDWPDCEEQAEALGRELGAQAVALAQIDMDQLELEILCGYNLRDDQVILPTQLDLGVLPRLASAVLRGRALRLAGRARHEDIGVLLSALDLDFGEHLMVVQLEAADENGGLFALLLRTEPAWSLEDEQGVAAEGDTALPTDETEWEEFSRALDATEGGEPSELSPPPAPLTDKASEPPTTHQAPAAQQPEPEEVAVSAEVLAELEAAQAEKEQYRRDVERLLAYVDRLESAPAADPATLERRDELIEALQRENEELRSAATSWDAGPAPVSVPSTLEAQEAKEELRLALQQVAALQVQLDEAMRAQSEAAPQAAGSGSDKIPADKAEVIASIAQELRQPLSSVLGYTDLLLSESVGILGALQRNFLERVRSSTTRMNNLIDNLIQVAELDSAGYRLDPKPVDMSAVIDAAIGLIRPHLLEKEIVLRVDMPPRLPELHTDRDALQQILFHLLQNADAATPAEGEITLRAFTQQQAELGEFIMVQVSDSGGGIPEAELPRVFSRVYRAKNPIIQGVGDTGVGLTIAETLTQALGGRIWVESEEGEGATFSVLLPLQAPAIP